MRKVETFINMAVHEIDVELQLCDWLLAHAVGRRDDLANRVVHPAYEYKRNAFIVRLDEEITDFANRADLLATERESLIPKN